MVHHLEVPLPLTRFQIHANQAFAEQIVARTMAAVEVGRRRFNGQVNETEFFVDCDLSPHAGVAVCGPRIVLPCIVAELTGSRNRVERPKKFAAFHIKRAHLALAVVVGFDGHAFFHRHADNHNVLHNGRRGMETGIAVFQIDLLAGTVDNP